jgi:Putative peptidase family
MLVSLICLSMVMPTYAPLITKEKVSSAVIKKALPARIMWFYTEYNGTEGWISSGAANSIPEHPYPEVEMSLVVTCKRGGDFKSGQTINFTIEGTGATLVTTTASTDAKGQCRAIIKSSGIADMGTAIIKARWVHEDGVLEKEVQIYQEVPYTYFDDLPSTEPVGPSGTLTFLNPSNPVGFVGNAPSWVDSYVAGSRNVWTIPGKITFQPGISTQLLWADWQFNQASNYYAFADIIPGMTESRTVYYNKWALDGDPADPMLPSYFARISWSHHAQSTVNHETGHLLGLGHSSGIASTMYSSIDRYFIWKTTNPTPGTISVINSNYPKP